MRLAQNLTAIRTLRFPLAMPFSSMTTGEARPPVLPAGERL